MGKPEVKRPHGRAVHKWEDIKIYIKEIGWDGMDWFIRLRVGTSCSL
jgi:hypothetical protein